MVRKSVIMTRFRVLPFLAGISFLCASQTTGKEHWFEENHLKFFLKGSLNIRRYCLTNVTKRLIFPYDVRGGRSELINAGL